MLIAVKDSIPELFRFVHSVYAQTSSLFCRDRVVKSSEGVQQGDPLGPLLFCLTIHPMVEKLRSELRAFYLDDGTLGGNLEDALCDFHLVEKEAVDIGLHLNRSKSELLCEDPITRNQMLKAVPGLQMIGIDQAEILGAPVGSTRSVDVVLEERVRLLGLLGERLRLLQAQDALLLLRHSFTIPKVLHVLRSSPCFTSTHLCDFDDLLRDILSDMINVTLKPGLAWLQASLPVHAGGIGIRSTAQLAPSAYLASAAGCTNLVQQIPPPATSLYQPLHRLCLNHLEPGPQSSSPHSSCQPSPAGLGCSQGGGPPADSLGILKWPNCSGPPAGSGHQGVRGMAQCPTSRLPGPTTGQQGCQNSSGPPPQSASLSPSPMHPL